MSIETNRRVLEVSLHFWFAARNALMESEPLQSALGHSLTQMSPEDTGRLAETANHVFGYEEQTGRDILKDYTETAGHVLSADDRKLLEATEILAKLMDGVETLRGAKDFIPRAFRNAETHMAFATNGLHTLSAACTPKEM